jgi:WD40 repeat protein/DNA polymerase III delta prime subunit
VLRQEKTPTSGEWTQLSRLMQAHFDLQELRQLCFDLSVNYETLGENLGLPDRVNALIRHLVRHNRLDDLLEALRQYRPAVDWPATASLQSGLLDLELTGAASVPSRRQTRKRRNELAMLAKVRHFWIEGVLERSVHGLALMELGKQEQAEAVDQGRPWDIVVEAPDEPDRPLTHNQPIVGIYDELGHTGERTLLILGDPGAGKTITLLELARDLVGRAERDAGEPLPVIFNLSAWGEKQRPLAEWLVEELNLRYQIPTKIGREWLENDDLILLLDGLDEVKPELQPACVTAINTFRRDRGFVPIVVCSRIQDYEALKSRLHFRRAIRLLSLTPVQIDDYLGRIGAPLADLRQALTQDETLRELAQSPLMLSIMSLAYRDLSPAILLPAHNLQSLEARRDHLFDAYVQRMFQRRSGQQLYTPAQTVRWLSWLAQNMAWHSQSQFLIEQLQPSWLFGDRWRWFYLLTTRLLGGLLIGLFLVLPFLILDGIDPEMLLLLAGSAIVGLSIGLVDGLRYHRSQKTLLKEKGTSGSWHGMLHVALITLVAFLGVAITFTISFGIPPSNYLGYLIELGIFSFIVALPFGLIFGLRGRWQSLRSDIRTVESLNWSKRVFGKSLLWVGILPALLLFIITTAILVRQNPGTFLWDVETGEMITQVSSGLSVMFSEDGRYLVTQERGHLRLLNSQTGEPVVDLKDRTLDDLVNPVSIDPRRSVYFSPDDRYVVVPMSDWSIRIWDSQTGERVFTLETPNSYRFFSPVFSEDGSWLVTFGCPERVMRQWPFQSDKCQANLWNTQSRTLVTELTPPQTKVHSAHFSPDGQQIITVGCASVDEYPYLRGETITYFSVPCQYGPARLWATDTGKTIANFGAAVSEADFSLDGQWLWTIGCEEDEFDTEAGHCTIVRMNFWDGKTGKPIVSISEPLKNSRAFRLSLDNQLLATINVDNLTRIWDTMTGDLIAMLTDHINTVYFTPDSERLVTVSDDEMAQLWSVPSGDLITALTGHTDAINMVYFSPDSKVFVTLSRDGTGRLWDALSGALITTLPLEGMTRVSFGLDGRRLITEAFGSSEMVIGLWDVQTGTAMVILEGIAEFGPPPVSSDGSRMIKFSGVWDINTGKPIIVVDDLPIAHFSQDGRQFLTQVNAEDWRFLAVLMLGLGFVLACMAGVQHGVVETKSRPNQGILLTIRNALLVGIMIGLIASFVILIFGVVEGVLVSRRPLLEVMDSFDAGFISLISLSLLLLMFIGYGGLDATWHYILRLILTWQRHMPWRYARFLDYAAERVFLQKVGGYYIFIHRLLLEYFASLAERDNYEPGK